METLFCEFYPPAIASNLPEIASNLQPIATKLPAVASNLPAIASNMPEIESSFPAIASNLSQQLHSIFQQLHAIYLSHQLHLTKTFDSFSLSVVRYKAPLRAIREQSLRMAIFLHGEKPWNQIQWSPGIPLKSVGYFGAFVIFKGFQLVLIEDS